MGWATGGSLFVRVVVRIWCTLVRLPHVRGSERSAFIGMNEAVNPSFTGFQFPRDSC